MSGNGIHIIRKNIDPDVVPSKSGIHWINELTKEHWFSIGTTTVADWVSENSDKGLTFTQTTPLLQWVINHNFGKFPIVQIIDSGSNVIEAEVIHPSLNQTVVKFTVATAGIAKLNV